MKKTSFAVIVLLVSFTSVKLFSQNLNTEHNLFAQNLRSSTYTAEKTDLLTPFAGLNIDRYYPRLRLLSTVNSLMDSSQSENKNLNKSNELENPNRKSVWIGAGLSALVPGAGEFYAKSFIKSAIFFGIEVACWSAYALYNHKGNVQTNDFQNFANANWDIRRYANWLKNQAFDGNEVINPNEPNLETLRLEINQCEAQNFSHTLPDWVTNSQQYYEVIGKYQNFQAGWVGADQILTKQNYETTRLPIFETYAGMRDLANKYYNDATTGAMIAIVNHILSAADAAWSVSIFNKKLEVQTGMEIRSYITPYTYETKSLPTMKVQINF
jgi:hypothetical protein